MSCFLKRSSDLGHYANTSGEERLKKRFKQRSQSCFGYIDENASVYFSLHRKHLLDSYRNVSSSHQNANPNNLLHLPVPHFTHEKDQKTCKENSPRKEKKNGIHLKNYNVSPHIHVFVGTLTGKYAFHCCNQNDCKEIIQPTTFSGLFAVLHHHISRYQESISQKASEATTQCITFSTKRQTLTLCFLPCDPLLLVSFTINQFQDRVLQDTLLRRLHRQIIFLLTKSFHDILSKLPGFPLQVLFCSTDIKYFRMFLQQRQNNLYSKLDAIEPLYLSLTTRYIACYALKDILTTDPIILGLMLYEARLVTLCFSKYYSMDMVDSKDLLSVILMLNASEPVLNCTEHWIPLCFPTLHDSALLTLYIKRIDSLSIVYISASAHTQQFLAISSFVTRRVIPSLRATGCFERFKKASYLHKTFFSTLSEGLLHPLHIGYATRQAYVLKPFFSQFAVSAPLLSKSSIFYESLLFKQRIKHEGFINNQMTKLNATKCTQVITSPLLNPLSGLPETIEKPYLMERIHVLYDTALRLAKKCDETHSLPVQIEIQNHKEKIFCIIGQSNSFFCCIPLWADWSQNFFDQSLKFLQRHQDSLMCCFFPLTHYT